MRGAEGELALALKLWPGTPRALTLRPISTSLTENSPIPGLLLAESPEDRPTLILQPPGVHAGAITLAPWMVGSSASFA